MNHLLRSHAPISEAGWELLDAEARQRLAPALAARKLVDFSGPHGWEHSAINLGRVSPLTSTPSEGVSVLQRRVLPLIEIRADFVVSRAELRDADRGATDVDLGSLDAAAHQIAVAENVAVFEGWPDAIEGIAGVSPHDQVELGDAAELYPAEIAAAVDRLRGSGIDGPYGLALGPDQYQRVAGAAEHGGYPVRDHLDRILDGPIVWAPGITGALLSLRGGDFELFCGQDLAIGYDSHDSEGVRLYLQESFAFHVATPEAAIALKPAQR